MPRQLSNATHAHLEPPKLSPQPHAGPRPYGVLDHVSMACPPVRGRLHTRYAPVRRSPARHCCLPLPLDLHVLGLPLAFILSQDQTLHCMNCSFLLNLNSSVSSATGLPVTSNTRYLLFHPFQCPFAFPFGENVCKDTTFCLIDKIFFDVFL